MTTLKEFMGKYGTEGAEQMFDSLFARLEGNEKVVGEIFLGGLRDMTDDLVKVIKAEAEREQA